MIDRRQHSEYKGGWWLPESADKKMMGILRYSPEEGFELEIIGSFFELEEFFSESQNPEIILGITSNGKNITLSNCLESKKNFSSPGSCSIIYKPTNIFVGINFDKDITFNRIIINYSHLEEWVNINGFELSAPSANGELQIKYKRPDDITISLDDNYKVSVTFSVHGPNWSLVQKESCIKQITYVMIESKNEVPLPELENLMFKIRNFLCLGVGRPIYPLAIIGQTEKSMYEIEPKVYSDIEIYYNFIEIPDSFESIIPQHMFFSFGDISESFEKFVKNWMRESDILAPVFNLYFGTIYNPKSYLDTKFLNVVQAIESYHRRKETTIKFDVSLEEHRMRMEKILSSTPIEHRKWLEGKLAYSNEVTLRQRLNEIISMQKEIAGLYIGDGSRQKEFISDIVTNRNYLTHFDKSLEPRRAVGRDLLIMVEKLKILIRACLLQEIGMSNQEIETISKRNKWQFSYFN